MWLLSSQATKQLFRSRVIGCLCTVASRIVLVSSQGVVGGLGPRVTNATKDGDKERSMCGVLGWLSPKPVDPGRFGRALDLMSHRGPNDRGVWIKSFGERGHQVALGHRRLAILDLSPRGHQPMHYDQGRFTIVYNGEIFNYRQIRAALEEKGIRFLSDSDTEVILAAWKLHGPECLHLFNGMFTFALWDFREKEFHFVRDRVGVKPAYWTEGSFGLAVASEIKSLLELPGVPRLLNEAQLAQFLNFLWVPGPETLFKGIYKLEPGHRLVWKNGRTTIIRWWDLPTIEARKSESEWIEEVRALVDDSVQLQLVSDVPIGVFLSGGVDSSAILAAMRRHTAGDITAYAVGYHKKDQRYEFAPSDLEYARIVAKDIKDVDYHEIILEPNVAELLPKLVWHMDEPVADAAAISTYLICKAANQRATVMLSGVGAEEIFGGYQRYRATQLAETFLKCPPVVRRGVRWLADTVPGSLPGPLLAFRRNLQKFVASAELPFEQRFLGFCGYYKQNELRAVLDRRIDTSRVQDQHLRHYSEAMGRSPINRLLYVDQKTFLPCLNLTYTDKAAMAASVEVRVPLLDHRIVELAATMPDELKVRGEQLKWIFKEAVKPWVPETIVKRAKSGFGGPTRSWVKNEFRALVDELLSESTLRSRGLLNPPEVRRLIQEDRAGYRDHAFRIWAFVTFELWMQTFLDTPRVAHSPRNSQCDGMVQFGT